jgi:hypothetical protein
VIVKRTRAAAGLATAFALLAVTAPGGPVGLATSSEPVDVVVPPEDESSEAFSSGEIGYEPSESVSVEVPSVAGRDLAAASRTVVTRMQELEAGNISDRALGSYTFAAQAMQKADPDCAVSWSTLAAIGRIESAHGTKDGARLKDSGVADPAIRGAALNGRNGSARVKDTDEGRFDEDRRWDRAVGPMQLLPSTWSYVGVDGDGNGKRTPDDLDDAALAVGVYLCAAADKATEKAGKKADTTFDESDAMRKALAWFNPSPAYGVLARRLDREYLDAYGVTPYSAAPDGVSLQAISLVGPLEPTMSADRAVVAARAATATKDAADTAGNDSDDGSDGSTGSDGSNGSDGPGNGSIPTVSPSPTPEPTETPTEEPTETPTEEPTETPTEEPTEEPTETPTETPTPTPTPDPEPTPAATFTGMLVEVDGIFSIEGVEITGLTPAELAPYVGQIVVVTYDPNSITPQ